VQRQGKKNAKGTGLKTWGRYVQEWKRAEKGKLKLHEEGAGDQNFNHLENGALGQYRKGRENRVRLLGRSHQKGGEGPE